MKTKLFIIAVTMLFIASAPAFSAITVVSARGETGVLEKGKAVPLKAGMPVKEGSTIVTGVNSEVVLDIDGSKLTLRSLTTMKVMHNSTTATSSDTRVAMKRGSVVSEVKKIHNVKTSFKVSTPVATSSVAGNKTHGDIRSRDRYACRS